MPELPDVLLYIHALESRLVGQPLIRLRVTSPFVLRTVRPPVSALEGRHVRALGRLGKHIVLTFDDDLHLVVHLMVAGRFQWRPPGKALGGRNTLASLQFANGTLFLTEASRKKRAAIHVVEGTGQLASFDRGGRDVLTSSRDEFAAVLQRENHTVKRALTDPRLFSGIGNAYSDEILHRARMSPLLLTMKLSAEQITALHTAAVATLSEWIARLRAEARDNFPSRVTAFRPEMAVHGRYGHPCPVCGTVVRRIVYAENECNYCPTCQTGGRLLADRGLSRLLKQDWPRDLDEWEVHFAERSEPSPGDA